MRPPVRTIPAASSASTTKTQFTMRSLRTIVLTFAHPTLSPASISVAMLLGVAFFTIGCGGENTAPATASPGELVIKLIQGNAPGPLARIDSATCAITAAGPDVYSANCDKGLFLVNVRTLAVTPGDAGTRRRWDIFASETAPEQPVLTLPSNQPNPPSADEIAAAQCRAEGGTMSFGRCSGGTTDQLTCTLKGGDMILGVCIGGRR